MEQTNKTKIVFSIYYAAELMDLGHKIIKQIPNPLKPTLTAWVFEVDDTFEADFRAIKERK